MNRLTVYWLISLLISCYHSKAQQTVAVDNWMEYIAELASETEDEERMEALYAELSYRAEHPFELNRTTAGQLQTLPFLSDEQIKNICSYIERYGPMVVIYELKNIESLDFRTIKLLLPFVYIGEKTVNKRPFSVDNFVNYGRNELQIRYDQCFQQKKGYRSLPDSVTNAFPNRSYTGEPFYHSLRYGYTFDERLQAGFTAEKDAGEPFANKHNKGYDYTSFHLLIKEQGRLQTLAIGDYKFSFGQGLVASHDFTPGRSAIVTQAERRTYGFRRHFSTNESDFLRGIAATLRWDEIALSLFYSYRKMDATLTDSLTVTSIPTNGLHRLPREREKAGILPMQTFGGNLRYAAPSLCLGLTAIAYSFGYEIAPDPKPYNLFYFRGRRNLNLSVDYLWKNPYLKVYGETALSANQAMATLNALQLTPVSYVSLLLLHRAYDKRYQAYFGNAFSQNTSVQNEQGFYAGLQFTPFAYWKISTYADFFRFPWLRYGIDSPSGGREYLAQLEYTQIAHTSCYLRYQYKQKEKNAGPGIVPYEQHRLRLQAVYPFHALLLKTSADAIRYTGGGGPPEQGFLLAQSLSWQASPYPFRADIFAALFRTDSYNTRLSSYEKNLPYAFSMPQFYGKGSRFALNIRWDVIDKLTLSGKLSLTHYTDRERIGTDLEEIEGRTKTDLSLLLCWKF